MSGRLGPVMDVSDGAGGCSRRLIRAHCDGGIGK